MSGSTMCTLLYLRLTKLKNRKFVAPDFSKTLTEIRNTGADALQKSRQRKGYHELYLGHATKSIAEIHYLTHGEVDPDFDKAVEWLGRKLGVYEIYLNRGANSNCRSVSARQLGSSDHLCRH